MYDDIYDAKAAVEHLSGFNVANRYLIVLYYNPKKQTRKARVEEKCSDHIKTLIHRLGWTKRSRRSGKCKPNTESTASNTRPKSRARNEIPF